MERSKEKMWIFVVVAIRLIYHGNKSLGTSLEYILKYPPIRMLYIEYDILIGCFSGISTQLVLVSFMTAGTDNSIATFFCSLLKK